MELAVLSTKPDDNQQIHITLPIIEETVQRKALSADKDGDAHYDVISALQKSIRGSDVDAALHYAARIIESGDLNILARRLTVIAYEDIGLANPGAAQRAVTAIQAAQTLGFPEARIPIANAIIELALSPSQMPPTVLSMPHWLTFGRVKAVTFRHISKTPTTKAPLT